MVQNARICVFFLYGRINIDIFIKKEYCLNMNKYSYVQTKEDYYVRCIKLLNESLFFSNELQAVKRKTKTQGRMRNKGKETI